MRPCIRVLSWCCGYGLLGMSLLTVPTARAEDRALLIGIERYADRRIPALPGCEQDAEELATLLREGCGMSADQVKVLRSSQATYAEIVRGLEEWLVAGTAPGDRVVFYYSGHGSQARDDNGDEEDGRDEVLCPSDYDLVTQANMLRDDRLGEALQKLEGRNVTVILDACHSGTAYKAIGEQVYPDPIYPTDNVTAKFLPPPGLPGAVPAAERTTQVRGGAPPTAGTMIDSVTRNLVVFCACADYQRAEVATFFENGRLSRRSVFTHALLQGLAGRADRDQDGQISNAELIDFARQRLVRADFDFTQTPTLQCSELYRAQRVFDRTLTLAGPPRLFYARDKQATINRGEYHDVSVGDRFVVAGTAAQAENPAEVSVTRVEPFLSFGSLSKDIHFTPPGVELRKVVRLRPFQKLAVIFGRFADPAGNPAEMPAALRLAAAGIAEVRVVTDQSECDRIVSGTLAPDGTLQVFLYGRFGRLQGQFSAPLLQAGAELARRLRGQVLLEQLAALDDAAPPFHLNLSVKGGKQRFLIYPPGDPRREKVELVVTAEQDCYLVLLSVDSQGQVTLLLPNKWQQDTKIVAGRTYTIPPPDAEFVFPIQSPPGHDIIKAIATRKPFDLRHVNTKDLNAQGCIQFDPGDWNDLVEDIRTRGIGVEAAPGRPPTPDGQVLTAIPTAEWTTATLTVETLLP